MHTGSCCFTSPPIVVLAAALFAVLSAGPLSSISRAGSPPASLSYRFTDLAPLGGTFSSARAVNNNGLVAGFSSFPGGGYHDHATIWDGSTPTGLATPALGFSAAYAINNAGQTAGSSSLSPQNPLVAHRASFWNGAKVVDLGPPGSEQPSVGNAVNDSGQVAGWAENPRNGGYQATVWNGAKATPLDTLAGWSFSSAQAINNAGQAAGYSTLRLGEDPSTPAPYRATLWNGSLATDLGTLGGQYSVANAINEAGEVAGWAQLAEPDAYHAALWRGSTVTDLGTLGGISSAANAINSTGMVVGWAATADNIQHATLWNGATAADLNSLLDPGAANTGWVLVAADGINDRGWIVGDAINTQTHQFRGFLLTPVAEPETYAMFLAGVGLIAGTLLRRRK